MKLSAKIAALAAAALLTVPLAACGGSKTAGGGDGKITLTVSVFNDFGYDELYKQYMKENPNIKIEERRANTIAEARTNLQTRLATGSGLADIEAAEGDWMPELVQQPDKWVDLSDDSVKDRWVEWKTARATVDGKLLGYGTDIGPNAVCYRSDLFAKAGLPTDREKVAKLLEGDWANFHKVGQQFTQAAQIPWYDSATSMFQARISQMEYAFENEDGTPIPLDQNTEIKKVYDEIVGTFDVSARLVAWQEDWNAAFQNDGFATILCPTWMLGIISDYASGVKGWDVANAFPGGGSNSGGSYLMVPTQSKQQEEAKKLANWLTAPEQQVKAFEAKQTFPSQKEAQQHDSVKNFTLEYYNNAPIGKIYTERAEKITVVPFAGKNYAKIRDIVGAALNRVETGVEDAETSWNKAVEEYKALGI